MNNKSCKDQNNKYFITDFGARADGSLSTAAIQAAIDACYLAGGGEVIIPEGRFLTGGIRLRSHMTLRLLDGACLLGVRDPEEYTRYLEDSVEPITEAAREGYAPTAVEGYVVRSIQPFSRWNNAIIRAIGAHDISIIGEGSATIDGQNCYDAIGEENYRGPHAINLWYCERVRLSGYTIRDSANWAHAIQNSRGIQIRGVKVLGGHDGFDVRTCDDVLVEDCEFRTGDDCIAGFDNQNVRVRNCFFNCACTMLRFGGTDVIVEDCRGTAPAEYGFRHQLTREEKEAGAPTDSKCRYNCHGIFLYYCDRRAKVRETPGKIIIRNSHFSGMDNIISHPFGHMWCCNRALHDITFENCVIEGLSLPSDIVCPEEEPLQLTLRNCTVSPKAGCEDMPIISAKGVGEIKLEGVRISGFTDPHILTDKSDVLHIENGDFVKSCLQS